MTLVLIRSKKGVQKGSLIVTSFNGMNSEWFEVSIAPVYHIPLKVTILFFALPGYTPPIHEGGHESP
jgi:hypothetical protein